MTSPELRKKILFITPPYHSGVPELAGCWIPLNFVYLAGSARESRVAPEIYDASTKDHGFPQIEERLAATRPEYVATSAMTATIGDAVKTLEIAKRVNPSCVTLLGGIHPTFMYEEIFGSTDAVDYIIIGEGEITLKELLLSLERKAPPSSVAGLAFREGTTVTRTGPRQLAEDLDELPAAWDLIDWPDYRYFIIPDSRMAAVSTSRGCTHDCTFCSQQRFWEKRWRSRDPRKVADEIEYLHRRFQVNVFLITDEHPTCSRDRWEAFLDEIIAREISVYFIMETRAGDVIRDREIFWKYRRAGVIHVSIGIESVRQATLDAVGKKMQTEEPKAALDIIHSHGIVSEASFLIGFPDETADSIKETFRLAQYYNPDNANFFPLTPWPYSEMYDRLKPYIRERNYARYNLIDPIIEPEHLSIRQIEVAGVDCYRKFYMGKIFEVMTMKDAFKRNYLVRATKLIMGSSFIIKKMSSGMLGKIPAKIEEMTQKLR